MYFVLPLITLGVRHIILIAAAVIPAIALLVFVYKSDRVERESRSLIGRLIMMGIVSTFIAIMCENLGSAILGLFFSRATRLYNILLYFVVVGLSEEASKFTVLDRVTWDNVEFNCKFDGIVYAVTVSLGFALWENIDYVLSYGFGTALLRAVTAVPGHACFGVFMGAWYGMAKRCELRGDLEDCKTCRKLCIIMPAFLHGCYDYIASSDSTGSFLIFVVFVVIMFVISYAVVKRLSARDAYLR